MDEEKRDRTSVSNSVVMNESDATRVSATDNELHNAIVEGDALCKKGQFRAAIRAWQEIVEGLDDSNARLKTELGKRIADAYFQRSQLSLQANANRKAIARGMTRLQEALEWDPDNEEYLYRLGVCHWRLGEIREANELLDRAVRRGAGPRALYLSVLAKLHAADPAGALELLQNAAAARSKSIPEGAWRRLKALAIASSGGLQEAISLLKRKPENLSYDEWITEILTLAMAARPSQDLCRQLEEIRDTLAAADEGEQRNRIARLLGDVYTALGKEVEAVASWREAKDDQGRIYDRSKVLSVCERKGLQAADAGRYEEAEGWCELALDIEEGEAVVSDVLAAIYALEGNDHWEKNFPDDALKAWERSLDRKSSLSPAWNLAVAFETLSDWSRAAAMWQTAAELAKGREPEEGEATMRRCLSLLESGDLEAGEECVIERLRAQSDATLQKVLGFVQITLGRYDEAYKTLSGLEDLLDDDADAALGTAIAADLAATVSDTARVRHWHRALKATEDPDAWERWRQHVLEVGLKAWESGEYDEAMRTFASLLLENRCDADGWIWCGTLHLQQGAEEKAKECFSQAISVSPKSAETQIKLGGCYLMAGREDVAHEYFTQAVEMSPSPIGERLVAEMCLEVNRSDLAVDYLRAGIMHCGKDRTELFSLLRLLVRTDGGTDNLRELLDNALAVSSQPARIRLLIAVQHLKSGEWRHARETLNQVAEEAAQGRENDVQKDVEELFRALIVPMTVGMSDEYQLDMDKRVIEMVDRWAGGDGAGDKSSDLTKKWRQTARELLWGYIDERLKGSKPRLLPVEVDLSLRRLEVPEPAFGQALDLYRLLDNDTIGSEIS